MSTIFVFGSNREGRHGKGAALEARRNHGAMNGYPEGRQGDSYAIITKELRPWMPQVTLLEILAGVTKFLEYAEAHPDDDFDVTAIGCGHAGWRPKDIAPMFMECPPNVMLPPEFVWELAAIFDPKAHEQTK